jgi:hypothetical protein
MDRTEVRTSAFTRTSSVFDGNGLEFQDGSGTDYNLFQSGADSLILIQNQGSLSFGAFKGTLVQVSCS